MLFLKIGLTILVITATVLPCYSKSHGLDSKLVKRATDNDSKSVPRKYHSNHPPLEDYAPISIPVAIVYDGNQDKIKSARTERTITTYHPRFFGFETTEIPIGEPSSPTTVTKTTTLKNSVISDKKPYKSRAQITRELHIPVVVVYDPVTDKNIKRNILNTETVTEIVPQRNRQRQRTLKSTTTDASLTTVGVTVTEKSDPTAVTPATKKRLYVPSRVRNTTPKEKQERTTQVITENTPTTLASTISTITESTTPQIQKIVTLQDENTEKDTIAIVVTPPRRPSVVSRTRATTIKENLETSTPKSYATNPTTAATSSSTIVKESIRRKPTEVSASEKPNYSSATTVKPRRTKAPVVPIVESQNVVYAQNGAFHYSYEGGDGTKNFENGELKSFDDDLTGEAVSGGFSYKDKDGNSISLTYTADENGYRPIGAHLPTPPPIPPAIARALKYLATKTPEPDEVTESLTKSE